MEAVFVAVDIFFLILLGLAVIKFDKKKSHGGKIGLFSYRCDDNRDAEVNNNA